MLWGKLFKTIGALVAAAVFYCEFLVYYVVLAQCKWPELAEPSSSLHPSDSVVRAMIIADTHLLGPIQGHWFDKLVREWHMRRAFQSSMTLFRPDVVFILGDLFDEGHLVNDKYYARYVRRFHNMFYSPADTQVISVVGNHDVGFHYKLHPIFMDRFEKDFNNTGVRLVTIKGVHFVVVNSMAMENDKCSFCIGAQRELGQIGKKLSCMKDHSLYKDCGTPSESYTRPILMQHFPTYRISDALCSERDTPKIERFKENWDVLSLESTKLLGRTLHPRLAFSGHTHHYCKLRNRFGIDEYSVASFSWRNKLNPSFLLAQFTTNSYGVSKCNMPVQNTNVAIYIATFIVCVILLALNLLIRMRKDKTN